MPILLELSDVRVNATVHDHGAAKPQQRTQHAIALKIFPAMSSRSINLSRPPFHIC